MIKQLVHVWLASLIWGFELVLTKLYITSIKLYNNKQQGFQVCAYGPYVSILYSYAPKPLRDWICKSFKKIQRVLSNQSGIKFITLHGMCIHYLRLIRRVFTSDRNQTVILLWTFSENCKKRWLTIFLVTCNFGADKSVKHANPSHVLFTYLHREEICATVKVQTWISTE